MSIDVGIKLVKSAGTVPRMYQYLITLVTKAVGAGCEVDHQEW